MKYLIGPTVDPPPVPKEVGQAARPTRRRPHREHRASALRDAGRLQGLVDGARVATQLGGDVRDADPLLEMAQPKPVAVAQSAGNGASVLVRAISAAARVRASGSTSANQPC